MTWYFPVTYQLYNVKQSIRIILRSFHNEEGNDYTIYIYIYIYIYIVGIVYSRASISNPRSRGRDYKRPLDSSLRRLVPSRCNSRYGSPRSRYVRPREWVPGGWASVSQSLARLAMSSTETVVIMCHLEYDYRSFVLVCL